MQIGYRCDVGQVRKLNEDSLMCLKFDAKFQSGDKSMGLFVVADGMGGHNAGEIASEWSIRTIVGESLPRIFSLASKSAHDEDEPASVDNPGSILGVALKAANKLLFEKSQEQNLQGMGTTITAALVTDNQDLYVAHIGDSRCYIINDRETVQLTKDHSVVQEMIDTGAITPEEAKTHSSKNVITRVAGYYQEVEADGYHRKLYQGDNVLLCSDGLWGVIPDAKIAELVLAAETPEKACTELVDLANQLGGPDNISVIIVRPEGLPSWEDVLTADTEVKNIDEPSKDSIGEDL